MLSPRQYVELFHLVFLRALFARGEDKTSFILKGGPNLRLYFGSLRYSEDVDLDVAFTAKDTLQNKIRRLLRAPTVSAPLKAHGVTLTEISMPKQTETTQRWKAGLRVDGLAATLRTKIEFSRRASPSGQEFAAVDRELARVYALPPFLATHYGAPAALAQKIRALVGPSEPQARDVFDLHHLLARPELEAIPLGHDDKALLAPAIERAMSISFDDYVAKVVAYLDPRQAELFESRTAWDAMKNAVASRLGELL
jgi:predicted nucleotidyltransferase component of viral defense system